MSLKLHVLMTWIFIKSSFIFIVYYVYMLDFISISAVSFNFIFLCEVFNFLTNLKEKILFIIELMYTYRPLKIDLQKVCLFMFIYFWVKIMETYVVRVIFSNFVRISTSS